MKDLIPLFRIDLIDNREVFREKIWKAAEKHYEQLFKELKKDLNHMIYLCSPLRPTKQKLVQDHISEVIEATSQILGAEYFGKKISVYIPHLHMFSVYNEIVYPELRERAIKFNDRLIQEYFHTLLIVGNRISGGMASEIKQAKKKGMEVIKMADFKKQLKNLPDLKKAKESYQKMVSLHNKIHGSKFSIEQ